MVNGNIITYTGEMPPRRLEIVKWAVATYGYLMETERYTFGQLSLEIRTYENMGNIHTRFAAEALRDAQTIQDWQSEDNRGKMTKGGQNDTYRHCRWHAVSLCLAGEPRPQGKLCHGEN